MRLSGDILVSKFAAFKFNLYRYNAATVNVTFGLGFDAGLMKMLYLTSVGLCNLTHSLKVRLVSTLAPIQ